VGYAKEKKDERPPDPILKLRHAVLEAIKVTEKEAAERDGQKRPPQVSIWWEIVDDKQNGEHNGVRFWDNYSLVQSFENKEKYVIREDTRIGDLAAFVAYEFEDGADYFEEDDVEVDFGVLEGERVVASLEPRRFKKGEPATGTRTVSSTLMLAEKDKEPEKVATPAANEPEDEDAFDDIPF
jgi:hypothetical protein